VNNEDYIESGILELYAAGGLTQSECKETERLAALYPEIRVALDEACETMEAYGEFYAINPGPELKERIMQQIVNPAQPANNIQAEDTSVYPLTYPEKNKEYSHYKWLFAASVALFLLSGFLSFHFYSKWQQAENRLAGVMASEQQLAQNYKTTSLELQEQEKVISIFRNPEFKHIRLKGTAAHPEAQMVVYWNINQQEVYVDNVTLPKPPSGKQYQLWALDNGKPVDAGLIQDASSKARLQQMKNISSAQAFAVTLEPTGGSTDPTLEQLTVIGNIGS
jgi:anti-sigma-K factor RskA